jgi:glycosyltransferase involved in cell wall biosynthesis
VIRDGEDGFIVPIRDSAAIAEKLDKLASDRALLRDMMAAAQATAARFTWEAYRVGLVNAVKKMLKRSDNRTRM